ncbi:DNA polymerase III subunit delta' [Sphingomonas aerophila]|uniref:DNA polymerase-3 subunit delta n=1 Tax=Sphingomonas aerophila TaxID=1344948 RepID=A0A7W9BCW1_9SPHN|nr:DNA polymerase III subunit delta' [Sphingomonas aerophila]MBB5714688.1 DNA polymerase-3 subunit delta' [Sphingomonas aerophila]
MTSLVGHAAAQAEFDAALAGGQVHHAWLLAGAEGVGKATFAREAALRLIGDDARSRALVEARSHPDYQVVTREVWDKSSPPRIVPYDQRKDDDAPARSIRIAQVRALRGQLATPPALSSRRAVIIDAIDDLEREGSNALLKSLEEPPQGTVFFLVSHAPGKLLPTIRSRCRLLRFSRLSDADVAKVLGTVLPGADSGEMQALVTASEGAPGRGVRYAGLDVAGLDRALDAIARSGDRDHRERLTLGRALAGKAAQPRYELFLDRAPALIAHAARERQGEALRVALDAYAAARDLSGAAIGLSLDPATTVFEMAGLVARLSSAATAG